MSEHPRFKAHTYVSFEGRLLPPRLEAWALVGDIWAHSPPEAKFAVVEAGDGEFLVWEYDPDTSPGEMFRKDPRPPRWRAPTLDAAVMKAVHHGR